MMRFLLWLVLIPTFTFAQNNTQNIRGVVTDKLSQTPLIGVAIQIGSLQGFCKSGAFVLNLSIGNSNQHLY